ncbi:polyphosphate polymerase domain-containing protein [Gehongia tenuis]|uniref:Polyphosphate polymerase domain-containing protein n=1 Tax=Gehongia tenuis TaxID=2763655 RepID=A0A926D377_9FIRM|nr:polyphosphate polymerase domain-containing protein [Gehongia tenuis]MBC8530677.1 polyphosphate polymerase domain-containing protein [Gehongia tenuis]
MRTQVVLRQERKFLLTADQALRCERDLAPFTRPDIYNVPGGYRVRSLYFDTFLDKDYWDKAGGYPTRRKMRLRSYHPDSGYAQLEMKQKEGKDQRKRSLSLERDEAEAVARGDFACLIQSKDPFAAECYGVLTTEGYLPKVVIEYRRTAYTLPTNSIRITFDRDIRATGSDLDLFAREFTGTPLLPDFHVILEVKYNHFLPTFLRDALRVTDESESAASKYAMGRVGKTVI